VVERRRRGFACGYAEVEEFIELRGACDEARDGICGEEESAVILWRVWRVVPYLDLLNRWRDVKVTTSTTRPV
jgi:hypothetical protein